MTSVIQTGVMYSKPWKKRNGSWPKASGSWMTVSWSAPLGDSFAQSMLPTNNVLLCHFTCDCQSKTLPQNLWTWLQLGQWVLFLADFLVWRDSGPNYTGAVTCPCVCSLTSCRLSGGSTPTISPQFPCVIFKPVCAGHFPNAMCFGGVTELRDPLPPKRLLPKPERMLTPRI